MKIIITIILLNLISIIVFSQINEKQKIDAYDKQNDEEVAKYRIEHYYDDLHNFSDNNLYPSERKQNENIDKIVSSFFLTENVTDTNDLDTTNTTDPYFKIREYLQNIRILLSDTIINYEPEIKYAKYFYHEGKPGNENDSSYKFIKSETILKREYYGKNKKVKKDSIDLDIFLSKKPDDNLYIYSITKHINDTSQLKNVFVYKSPKKIEKGSIYVITETPDIDVNLQDIVTDHIKKQGELSYHKTGLYTMTISKPNYYDWSNPNIKIQPNKIDTIRIPKLIPKMGNIIFQLEPANSELYIDNEKYVYKNNAPYPIMQGKYTLEIKYKNYHSKKFDINLKENEVKRISETLEAKSGHINILNKNENASAASVLIDDSIKNVIPVKNLELFEGIHKICIEKDNCLIERKIRITEKKDTTIYINLVKAIELKITTGQSDANISIDSINAGKGTLNKSVSLGTHKIRISKQNYDDINDICDFTCDSKDTIELSYNIEPHGWTYVIRSECDKRRHSSDVYIYKDKHTLDTTGKTPFSIRLTEGRYFVEVKHKLRKYKTEITGPLKKEPQGLSSIFTNNSKFNNC